MKRGDIIRDGIIGYWIMHEKPNGRKLHLVPLDRMSQKPTKGQCSCWHDPKTWNLDSVNVICNLYDHPEKAASLLGDGNSLAEKIMSFANAALSESRN